MPEEPLAHRESAIDLLALYASADKQREYQRNVPRVNVADELVCMWFDDFWHVGDEPPSPEHAEAWNASLARFCRCFTAPELAALTKFHEFFSAREASLPLEDLDALLASPAWREVMLEAGATLAAFRSD